MSFDVNNQYFGTSYGKDRLGFTTPDVEATELLRPFLVNPYPAPWLPIRRRDEGHPVAAGVVISCGYLVGQDKSGGLIPAGLRSGATGAGGPYQVLYYGPDDVGFSWNPQTGAYVAAVGEYCVIAAPTDGAANDTVTLSNGVVITISAGDLAFGKACNLIPGGIVRPIGYAVRNVFQYLGAVNVTSTTNGMSYTQDGMAVPKFRVHNYMHEPGTALQTSFGLRVPYIGADINGPQTAATAAGLTGYTYDDFSRSFAHFVGTVGNAAGNLFPGCCVVADDQNGVTGAGHYRPYDATKHTFDQIVGRVLSVESVYPPKDFADRVRTQFDRAQQFVGPFADQHPVTQMMGGSSTRGSGYDINLATKGLLRALLDKGVTPDNIPAVAGTYVWMAINTVL